LKRLEEQEKEARRRETVELQSHYAQGQQDKAAYERMIDDLVAEDNARQWA
jgi:glucose-6-phosphate 1-dehydrogenase